MATDDQQRLVVGTASAPATFTVPGNGQIQPKAIFASYDGTGAAGPFLPALKITSDAGKLVGVYASTTQVAAGGTADVSWFPWRRVTTAAPAPSPNPLGTLWAWWDFSDTSTITLDGNSKITKILDKTGNAHNATQNTAAQRPSESTLNALNCGIFNSTAKTMLTATGWATALSQPFTVALVWTQDFASNAGYQPGPIGGASSPPAAILFDNFDNTKLVMEQGAGSILVAKAAPYTQQQATLTYNGGSSTFRLNGASAGGVMDGDAMTNFALGTSHNPSDPAITQELDGKIGEVLIYEGALTAAQLSAVEAYLKAKWATP